MIEQWDTYTGEVVATGRTGEVMGSLLANACRDGLILKIGDVKTDVALKIIRQPGGDLKASKNPKTRVLRSTAEMTDNSSACTSPSQQHDGVR